MNDDLHKKNRIPVMALVLTGLITAALTWGVLRLMGYHGSHPDISGDSGTRAAHKQLWTCGMHPWIVAEEPGFCPICSMELVPKRDDGKGETVNGERTVLYWRAPMDPMEIYEKPGKSKMGMDLVPVFEDEAIGGVNIKIDPVTRQNMGVRTALVEKGSLVHTIRTYGHVTYDETRTAFISPKVNGWIEKLYITFTGEKVTAGQPLFEIYSPELVSAQEAYLNAIRTDRPMGGSNKTFLESARRRLKYFDMDDLEIKAIETLGSVKKTIMIRSPVTGVVTEKNAIEGGYIKSGTTIFRVADLSRVWVEAHIYEYELGWIHQGEPAEIDLPYLPGRVFTGRVTFIYPYLQQKTRDVVIRLEFDNPEMILKPDMYADVRIQTPVQEDGIHIPDESVIRSGKRNVVFVDKGNGLFSPRNVILGKALDDGRIEILSGLAPGERVVISGQFLLDSESRLKEAVQKMMAAPETSADAAQKPSQDDFFKDMN